MRPYKATLRMPRKHHRLLTTELMMHLREDKTDISDAPLITKTPDPFRRGSEQSYYAYREIGREYKAYGLDATMA